MILDPSVKYVIQIQVSSLSGLAGSCSVSSAKSKINACSNGNMSLFVILCKLIGGYYQNTDEFGEWIMADMDKLMEFLQKEVPSNAGDLNNSINNTLEIIERTRAAFSEKYMSIAKNYFKNRNSDEIIANFENAENQLEYIQRQLHNFLENNIEEVITSEDILIEENDNEDIPEDEEIEEREGKIDYKKYLVDNKKPYLLSSDFENTTPDSFSFRGETYNPKSEL